jgi:hypothetical protein
VGAPSGARTPGASAGGSTGATSGASVGAPVGGATGGATNAPGVGIGNPAGSIAIPGPESRPPLNLNLPGATPAAGARTPPIYPNRPPLNMPQRSLSEMANEQLGVKKKDRLAEGVNAAGDVDCLNAAATPNVENKWGEANTAGLVNIGPLLKRTLEEKCRK